MLQEQVNVLNTDESVLAVAGRNHHFHGGEENQCAGDEDERTRAGLPLTEAPAVRYESRRLETESQPSFGAAVIDRDGY